MSHGVGQKWLIRGQELCLDVPHIMGILNVTPDSFSDGGSFIDPEAALSHALKMIKQGARIIDVGGESTRPGSHAVDAVEEISRIVPVIEKLALESDILISADTHKAVVAQAALTAGAHIINDVSAGLSDPDMFELISHNKCGYIMMHMQGTPETMQNDPSYENVISEIKYFFEDRLDAATLAGVKSEQIVFDPGIGFGKTLNDNLNILGNMSGLELANHPLMLGASRKSFIGMIDGSKAGERMGGSLAAVLSAHIQNVRLFRVHDVAETRQLLDIFTAIQKHSV